MHAPNIIIKNLNTARRILSINISDTSQIYLSPYFVYSGKFQLTQDY